MKTVQLTGVQTCGAGVFENKDTGIEVDTVLHTDGSGYWSRAERSVHVTALSVPYINDEQDFGELRVYFDTLTWDTMQHGLIYTDDQFERELRSFLETQGFDATDVSYSEQGMQGDNYVSLDVGDKFIASWIRVTEPA